MNNSLIKRAVELADDFSWPTRTMRAYGETPWEEPLETPCQRFLDALAAQLVRQVDALGPDYSVRTHPTETYVYEESGYKKCVGDDRTENTITAIVESKVLET